MPANVGVNPSLTITALAGAMSFIPVAATIDADEDEDAAPRPIAA